MKPKKEDQVKKDKGKSEKKVDAKEKKEDGKKAKVGNAQVEKVPDGQKPAKDGYWHPPEGTTHAPAEGPIPTEAPQAVNNESSTPQFVTPSSTEVIPFYYEQRPLDLTLGASEFQQKIQEYGLSKVDVFLPSDELPKELRRFKTLPPESQAALERLITDKSPIIRKRVLVILQYLYMVTSLV